jgi:hypothetical protein
MTSARTTTSDVFTPEVLTDTIQSAFAKQDAFMGSDLAAMGAVVINDTLTERGGDRIGSTIRIPRFGTLGDWVANDTDGDAVETSKVGQATETGTVQRFSKAFETTAWASWAVPGTDPYTSATQDMVRGATRAMDTACISAAVATGALTYNVYSASTPVKIDNDVITDACAKYWGDETDNEETALLIHSKTKADLLKQKDANGQQLGLISLDPATGKMRYFGRRVIVSDKCPLTGSSMPAMTLESGDNAPTLTGTPTGAWDLKIEILTSGALGTAVFRFSTDGGTTWSANITTTASTGINELTDTAADSLVGFNGATGLTATFASHSYTDGDIFTSKATLKVTSLLVKPRSLAFWYNRAALALETDKDILRDSKLGASHLYYVAHRYARRPGGTKPGIIQVTHNVTPIA